MSTLEKSLEKWFLKECKKANVLCLKLFGLVGISDRLLLGPNKFVAFVELKKEETGLLSEMQKYWRKKIMNYGFNFYVCDNKTELLNVLNEVTKHE